MSSLYDKLESKNSYRFLVVGTSMWNYFERVNFEYYNNLNLHIVDDIYIDKSSTQVVEFENLYNKILDMVDQILEDQMHKIYNSYKI
jgi:hypothetical protein